MTVAAPERSLVQRMEALQRANEIRTKRATLKRDLKAGKVSIHDLLLEPPEWVCSAKVLDIVMAAPKYGRVKALRVLRYCRVSPSKTVGGLSPRQRTALACTITPKGAARSERPSRGAAPDTQHMRALARANDHRLSRADIKDQIARGELSVTEVLATRPEAMNTMPTGDLLTCQHRWGEARARRLLASVPVLESRPLWYLTDRQRGEITRRLAQAVERHA